MHHSSQPMMTRRSLARLTATAAAALILGPMRSGPAGAQSAGGSVAFIKTTAQQLVEVVNGPGSTAAKQQQLRGIIDAAVDVDGVARFCLGRFWRTASPAQQTEFTRLFHDVLVNNITAKLGQYKGVMFTVGGAQTRDDGDLVATVVQRPNSPPTQVQWVVRKDGSPKVIDVIAEGTSLRLTQRSDYAAYVTRNGNSVDALLKAMRNQVQPPSG